LGQAVEDVGHEMDLGWLTALFSLRQRNA
jgi:hypothetical protein